MAGAAFKSAAQYGGCAVVVGDAPIDLIRADRSFDPRGGHALARQDEQIGGARDRAKFGAEFLERCAFGS